MLHYAQNMRFFLVLLMANKETKGRYGNKSVLEDE